MKRPGAFPPAPAPAKMAGRVHPRSVSPVPRPAPHNTASSSASGIAGASAGGGLRSRPNTNSTSLPRKPLIGNKSTTPVPSKQNSSSLNHPNNNNIQQRGSNSRPGSQRSSANNNNLPLVETSIVTHMDAAITKERELLARCEGAVPVLEDQLERAIEQRDVELRRVMNMHSERIEECRARFDSVQKEIDETNDTFENLLTEENTTDEKITMTYHQINMLEQDGTTKLEQREHLLKETLTLRRRILDDERSEEQKAHDEERGVGDFTTGLSSEGVAYVKAEDESRRHAARFTSEALSLEMKRRELFSLYQELKGTIRVYCRVKGVQNADELDAVNRFLVFPDAEKNGALGKELEVTSSRENATSTGRRDTQTAFAYDQVFGIGSTQPQVFEEVGPLVDCAVDGYKVCIFCYGQTGSGKTYTMEGNDANPGVIPRAIDRVFERAANLHEDGWTYQVKCSFLEIYNESIRNLLERDSNYHKAFFETTGGKPSANRVIHEIVHHGKSDTTVSGIHEVVVKSPAHVHKLLATAGANRSIAQTKLNDRSSRSHCVFTMRIEGSSEKINTKTMGILCLVDLAGSERVNESGATGQQLKEAIAINRSLMHLGECINSMGTNAVVSWRNCKLTYMLQNFLSGDGAKMLMFVNISNREEHIPETLNSLRFASKVNMTQIGQAKKRFA